MSPPLSELSLDLQYPSSDGYYDAYPSLVPATAPSDFYTSENFYLYPDADGFYHFADGSAARSDCIEYSFPLYHAPTFASETLPASAYPPYQHGHFDEPPQPAAVHDHSYIYRLTQQVANTSARPPAQSHRSSIALASDNFLAQASSLFSDAPLRRGSTLDHRSSVPRQSPQREPHPPSRKRSRDSLDEATYRVKGKDDDARSSLAAPTDACRLPQPHLMAPSQGLPPSSTRIPHFPGTAASLSESHARELESRLHQEERCTNPIKYTSNKRVRTTEELVRQEDTLRSLPPTWPIPDDQVIKVPKKPGEQKKQALACLFCRERKIACGRPHAHNPDQTCNQCARRRIKCEYPTESRRGQHKRRRKQVEGEPASQSAVRTNPTSSVGSTTAPSSTILMTTPASA